VRDHGTPTGSYFFTQQSPGQHDPPGWQQLAAQHEAEQHEAPGLQQESLVRATADKEVSDNTKTANSLYFMEVSSRLKRVSARAAGRTNAAEAQ
jgi:hypothetical protein